MKRIMLAYCVVALATAAQAAERHAQSTGSEGRAESALRWFAAHAGTLSGETRPAPAAHATRRHHAVVAASDETPAPAAHATRRHHAVAAASDETPAAVAHATRRHHAVAAASDETPAPAAHATRRHHAVEAASDETPAPAAQAARHDDVVVASASTETPTAAPTRSLATPAVLPSTSPRPGHGQISSCSEGARIISAFYADGSRTASGERFDPNGMTAAHRTLPFGTHLKVINPRNGKVVLVRVNDRGPFVRGVTLDLSRGAAHAIGLQGTGAVCMAEM